jgi:hypothetical protein
MITMTTKTLTKKSNHKLGRLHLDRRAAQLATVEADKDADGHLTTLQVANWLGVSTQWLEIQRGKEGGPPFLRLAPQMIRYRRDDVVKWLKDREFKRTSQYMDRGDAKAVE